MRPARSVAAAALLLAAAGPVLAGCHPARMGHGQNRGDRAVSVSDRLDCPASEGALTRTDLAADGRSCRYAGPDGQEARLSFLDLAGRDAKAALSATEAELNARVPAAVAAPGASDDKDDADDEGGHSRVDLPGVHIDSDHGTAHIRAFGQTVEAHGNHAVVHGGWNGREADVVSNGDGAQVRAGWFGDRSVDATYVLAAQTPGPQGDRTGGYIAKGPAAGPLVLGVETSKAGRDRGHDHHGRDPFHDLRRLVDLNVHR